MQLRLQPQLGLPKRATIAFDTGRGMGLDNCFFEEVLVGADGVAKVPVRWPGDYTVDGSLSIGGRRGAYLSDFEPRKIALPAANVVLRIGQKGFDAALQMIRK
jgi:hypothetical protein